MARERGHPYVALPIFPHRRFRHGFIFINTQKGILKPTDLIGGKIGVESGFQPAAAVWLRGILNDEYKVPHGDIRWVTDRDEDIPFTPQDGLRIERVESGSLEKRLVDGELDALISPGYPPSFLAGNKNIGRLFPDFEEQEKRYYRKSGIFPIMHLVVIKERLVREYPWIAPNIAFAFNESKRLAYERVRNPRVVPLAWFSSYWEKENSFFGHDPWEYGLGSRNKANLATLIRYALEQGLLQSRPIENETIVNVSEEALRGTAGF